MYRCGTTNLTRVKEYDLAHALCICVGALSGETNMWVGLIIVINPHTISIGHMSFSSPLTLDPSPTSPCMSLFWMQHEASQFTRCSKRGGQCCRRPLPSKELNCISPSPSFHLSHHPILPHCFLGLSSLILPFVCLSHFLTLLSETSLYETQIPNGPLGCDLWSNWPLPLFTWAVISEIGH